MSGWTSDKPSVLSSLGERAGLLATGMGVMFLIRWVTGSPAVNEAVAALVALVCVAWVVAKVIRQRRTVP